MASFTQIDVLSNVIILLGNAPIQTLANPSDIVTSALQVYNLVYTTAFTENMWRFAAKEVQLSQIVGSTPIPNLWQYMYAIPGDFLKTVRQWPQNYDFEIFAGGQFYSNLQGPLFLEYIYQVPIEQCPPYFIKYLIYEIACFLALSSAQNTSYYSVLAPERDKYKGIAMAMDTQNRPQTPLQSMPVLNQRWVSWSSGGATGG